MSGNGKVFISHVHEDNARAQPYLAMLDAWGVDYWFDTQQLSAGNTISERVQKAIIERDIFLLLATGATNRSLWTGLETQAFRGLMAQDRQMRRSGRRQIIYLVLDPYFQRPQLPADELLIDATRPQQIWLKELRMALGLRPLTRTLSRRTVLTAGSVAVLALAASGTVIGLELAKRTPPGIPAVIPNVHQPTATPLENATRLKWFFAVDTSVQALAVNDTAAFTGGLDGFFRLDALTGAVKWHNVRTSPAGFPATLLTVVNNVIYLPTSGGVGADTLSAVNVADGTVQWNAQLATDTVKMTAPIVSGDLIYVTTSGLAALTLFALKVTDGSVAWQTKIADKNYDSLSTPAVAGNLVIVGSYDNNVYGLDKATGAIRWHYQTSDKVSSSPAVANGTVFIGSNDTFVYALNAQTGTVLWKAKTGRAVNSSPIVANNVVYVGSEDTYLYALNAATGAVNWRTQAGAPNAAGFTNGDFIDSRPALGTSTIYVTAGKYLYAFDLATGKLQWRFEVIADGSLSSPIVANGLVYFAGDSDSHAVYAVTA